MSTEALHYAIRDGEFEKVKGLVESQNADVNAFHNGQTALHFACYKGHLATVQYLAVMCDANVHAVTQHGRTALHCASVLSGSIDVVRYLVDTWSVDASVVDNDGQTVLHTLTSHCMSRHVTETVKYLVETAGVDVHAKDKNGRTALHNAVTNHLIAIITTFDVARYLIDTGGAKVQATDNDGWTVLHHATASNDAVEFVKYIVEVCGANVKALTKDGKSPMALARSRGHVEVVRYLEGKMFQKPTNKRTEDDTSSKLITKALHEAVVSNNLAHVRDLVNEQGADVAATDDDNGMNALHVACMNGHLEMLRYLVQENYDEFASSVYCKRGWTALHYVCRSDSLEMVQCLVDSSFADPTETTDYEQTPLDFACQNGNLEMAQYLVETCGANAQARSENGCALHYACRDGHNLELVQYLVQECGANVDEYNIDDDTPLTCAIANGDLATVQYLVETGGANVHANEFNQSTALHTACACGKVEIMRYLVETRGVNVHAVDNDGETALHAACRAQGTVEMLQCLVETCQADIHVASRAGWTAVFFACHSGRLDMVQYLVETCHANVQEEQTDEDGKTCLHVASEMGHLEVVSYLVETCKVNIQVEAKNYQTPLDLAHVKGRSDVEMYLQGMLASSSVNATVPDAAAPEMSESTGGSDSNAGTSGPSDTNTSDKSTTAPITHDQDRMRAAVAGTSRPESFPVSESYVRSILTRSELGRGFFGTVYRAIDRVLNCSFAVKAIHTDVLMEGSAVNIQRTKQTFEKEQKTLSCFRHPNIAHLFAYSFPNTVRGNYYLVYEIAEKGALDSFWHDDLKRLRLSFSRRVQIALDILTALQFLHVGNVEKNVKSCYHRDIKSANIVLKQDLTAQLIDCGLARFVIDKGDGPAQSVSSASARGTPGYICPEYAQGEVMVFDCGCDIYSFGVVLVELWTGKLQNHLDENGAVFNFTTQYIKMRKGKPRRDITSDADSTFGFAPSDVLPDCMIRFVELARVCMDDHNDIPDGRDVMNELLAIRRACVADDDYASLVGDGALVSQRLCDRCRSFYAMPDGTICRLCWDSEQQRRGIQEITSLLQAIGLQTNRAHERLDAIGIDANVVTTKVDSAATQTNSARLQPPIAAPLLDDMDANVAFAIPRLFFVVPTEKNDPALRPRKYLDGTTATKFHLYFVCAHTKRPIDAPIRIHMTQQWLQNAAPVLAVTLHLLRYGLSVLGPQEGLFLQVSEELVGDLLAEVRTMKKTSSGEHSGLLNRLDSTQPLDSTDVPELSADLYDHLLEVATEQRQWMQHMEPVRTGSNPATQWVSKDVADNESHGYIKVR